MNEVHPDDLILESFVRHSMLKCMKYGDEVDFLTCASIKFDGLLDAYSHASLWGYKNCAKLLDQYTRIWAKVWEAKRKKIKEAKEE
jgi:hypothetical protein